MNKIIKRGKVKSQKRKRAYFPLAKNIKKALFVIKNIVFILDVWRFFQVSEHERFAISK